jgi:hypothetical protein
MTTHTFWHRPVKNVDGLIAKLLEQRQITEKGCWVWTGALDGKGYGRIRLPKFFAPDSPRLVAVHRLAAHLWNGFDLASPLGICHKCDNPPCFNPLDLFEGTHPENVADAAGKNRLHFQFRTDEEGRRFCKNGHLITPENMHCPNRSDGRVTRQCKICYTEYMRLYHRRKYVPRAA